MTVRRFHSIASWLSVVVAMVLAAQPVLAQGAADRGGPRESDSCVRWDPSFMRRISRNGEATEFFGSLQGESGD